MIPRVIKLKNAVDKELDTFQSTEVKEVWGLIEIACEEHGTAPILDGRSVTNGAVYFSIENEEVIDDVVEALKAMDLDASIETRKAVLMQRRAARVAEKKEAAAKG
jgi:hypothetical protein